MNSNKQKMCTEIEDKSSHNFHVISHLGCFYQWFMLQKVLRGHASAVPKGKNTMDAQYNLILQDLLQHEKFHPTSGKESFFQAKYFLLAQLCVCPQVPVSSELYHPWISGLVSWTAPFIPLNRMYVDSNSQVLFHEIQVV